MIHGPQIHSTTRKAVVTIIAWTIGLLIFFPILWTILMSFKSEGDAIKAPFAMLAAHWTLESYAEVQDAVGLPAAFLEFGGHLGWLHPAWRWSSPFRPPGPWPLCRASGPRTC